MGLASETGQIDQAMQKRREARLRDSPSHMVRIMVATS